MSITLMLTPTQTRYLDKYLELDQGVIKWSTWDAPFGRTTLLRVIALIEAREKPVTVLVPDTMHVKHFLRNPIFEHLNVSITSKEVRYGYGIRVFSCSYPEGILGCHRDCILVDDSWRIDRDLIQRQIGGSQKMFICE